MAGMGILCLCLFVQLVQGERINVALGRPAWQSSRHNPTKYGPENAVDGDLTTIIHTDGRKEEGWWVVQLRKKVTAPQITIFFRRDGPPWRVNDIQLYTSMYNFTSTRGGNFCHTLTTNTSYIQSVVCPGTWKYLMIYTNSSLKYGEPQDKGAVLDFSEVEIWVCSEGLYGEDCSQSCEDRHCKNDTYCDKLTGRCRGGCQPGWRGPDCTQLCSEGLYGEDCSQSCEDRHCKGDTNCDHVTGRCEGGCQPGWREPDCTLECEDGSYGQNCDRDCSKRQCRRVSASCPHETGFCGDEGCKAGRIGTDCTEECGTGFYGVKCERNCANRHCVNGTSCHPKTGSCGDEGCQAGWRWKDCTKKCPTGYYGSNCVGVCNKRHCVNGTSCDHQTGSCGDEGCQPGWKEENCTKKCDDGSYGVKCEGVCANRHCVNVTSCNHQTGFCGDEGCQAGWKGEDCTKKCGTGSYGLKCEGVCNKRHCVNGTSCNHQTGSCGDEGCQAGWEGENCTKRCAVGQYGLRCEQACIERHCLNTASSCDHQTGSCGDDGCQPGWEGEDCTLRCESGTYGENCNGHCMDRHCENTSAPCDRHTGSCGGDGCLSGYRGTDCTQECSQGYFGVDCGENCSSRYCVDQSAPCPHQTGACGAEGCQDGWVGPDCSEKLVGGLVPGTSDVVGILVPILVILVSAVIIYILYTRGLLSKFWGLLAGNKELRRPITYDSSNDAVHMNAGPMADVSSRPKTTRKRRTPMSPEEESPATATSAASVSGATAAAALGHWDEYGDVRGDTDYCNIGEEFVRKIPVEKIASTINNIRHIFGGFKVQFDRLPNEFMSSYADSKIAANAIKNKYKGYYPYDHNRVRLTPLPGISYSDYINASIMHSYNKEKTYIAAQAPKPQTVADFWRMIWEQDCGGIVMLTGLVEEGKPKCHCYWKDAGDFHTPYHKVELESAYTRAEYTVRHFNVISKTTNESRSVVQYHYTSWPDHGVPDTLALVNFIWRMRRTGLSLDNRPLLVHCSAGIGRTGTYIAVDSVLDQAREEGVVDVPGYVCAMRGQRKGMIQTKEQYECVFECLLEMTKFGNTSMDVENFTTSYSSRGLDSMVDRKTLRELTHMGISEEKKGLLSKNSLWVDGRQDFIVRTGPSQKQVRGFMLVLSPSPGQGKLLWKLVEENHINNIVLLTQHGKDMFDAMSSSLGVRRADTKSLTSELSVMSVHTKEQKDVKVYRFASTPTIEHLTQCLLTLPELRHVTSSHHPVCIIHSSQQLKLATTFCIMCSIISNLTEDRQVDVIGHVRRFLRCFNDLNMTENDVTTLLNFVQQFLKMTNSSNIYMNV